MTIFKRFPVSEIVRLGSDIYSVVLRVIPGHSQLKSIASDLSELSDSLMEIRQPESLSVDMADRIRDALVISLVHGIAHFSYRLDDKEKKQAADFVESVLFGDGYSWIKAPYTEESVRIHKLIHDAESHDMKRPIDLLGLGSTIAAIKKAQEDFEKTEYTARIQSEHARETLKELRIIIKDFHRKLDVYMAIIQDEFSTRDQLSILDELMRPLSEATERVKSRGEIY
ncbi:MAG: hypothetical protein JXR95_12740 [Deltaproteobacteria bacterium]|nr:hypothetical protein [Deltaproteobacteria bacterium]